MGAFDYKDAEKHEGKYILQLCQDIKEGNKILLKNNDKTVIDYDKNIMKMIDLISEGKIKQLYTMLYKNPIFVTQKGLSIPLTNIEKKPYSIGDSNKPLTEEQELITAKIFELLLGHKTKYDNFEDCLPELQKVTKFDILSNKAWFKSFKAQFEFIKKDSRIPNQKFDDYNRNGGFMDYISKYVKDEYNIGKKDSWNPADIWLINTSKMSKYKKLLEKMKGGDPKYNNINRLNDILKSAFVNKAIIGISLKKNEGKAFYELVNLQYVDKNFKELEFIGYFIDTSFDKKIKEFDVVSSYYKVKYKGSDFTCNIRRNQTGIAKNVFEFLEKGAKAQLGKVPVDYLTKYLREYRKPNTNVPDPSGLPKNVEDLMKQQKLWMERLNKIHNHKYITNKDKSKPEVIFDNLVLSYLGAENKLDSRTSAVMQIIWFASLLTDIKNIVEFSTDLFYSSQKKGNEFGPFGKLY